MTIKIIYAGRTVPTRAGPGGAEQGRAGMGNWAGMGSDKLGWQGKVRQGRTVTNRAGQGWAGQGRAVPDRAGPGSVRQGRTGPGPRNDLRGLTSRMEASLSSLNVWFSSHALKVNATKTQFMVFGSRQNLRNLPDFKISFRDTELQSCAQVGNLGVVFYRTLSWEAHVSELSRRCMGVLIGLSHARQ